MRNAGGKSADDLRKRAEQLLKSPSTLETSAELKTVKELAHELAIYQVELELQNEELREAQTALQEARDRFSGLYEHAPVGYVVLDSSGLIRQTNQTWRVMLNRDDDFRGKPFVDSILAEDAPLFLSRFRTFFKNPVEKSISVRLRRSDGTHFHARIEAGTLSRSARSAGEDVSPRSELLVVVSDITDLRSAQAKVDDQYHQIELARQRELRLNSILRAIRNVNQLITKEDDPARLIQGACENLTEELSYHNAWIAIVEDDGMVSANASAGFQGRFAFLRGQLERGEFPSCMREALATDAVIVVADPNKQCHDCPVSKEYAGRAGLVHRLEFEGKVFGILAVSVPPDFALDTEEQSLFVEVAGDIAFALHKIDVARRLRESQKRYLQIFERSRDGFVMVDANGRFIDANKAFCEMIGYTLDELKGLESFYEITPEHWRKWEAEEIWEKQLLGMGSTGVYEKEYTRKDGTRFPVELRAYCVRDERGLVEYLWGIARDITERKQVEDALKAREAQIQNYLEYAPHGVFITDRQGHYIEVNPEAERLTGYSAAQLVQMSIPDLLPLESREAGLQHFKSLMETGRSAGEVPYMRADGEIRYWRVSASALSDDRFLGFVEDVTERRLREEQIALLGKMLDEAPTSITIHGTDGRFVFANRATVRLHGYDSAEEFLALNLHQLDVPESEQKLAERFAEIARSGEARFEVAHFRKDGSAFPLEVQARAIKWRGEDAVLSIATDITERVKAQEALRDSEDRFRQIVERSSDVFYRQNIRTGRFEYVSPRVTAVFGLTPEEVLALSIEDQKAAIHPDDLPGLLSFASDLVEAARKGQTNTEKEFRLLHGDGEYRWVHGSYSLVPDESGEPLQIIGALHDITESKRAEEALRESEEKFSIAFRTSHYAIVVTRASDGKLLDVNPAFCDITGYPREEALASTSVGLGLWVDLEDRKQVLQDLRNGVKVSCREFSFRRKNGTVFTGLFSAAAVSIGGENRVISSINDISDRKLAEDALRRSERDLRESQRIAHVGSWRLDVATNQVVWSEELYNMYGFDPSLPPPPYTEHMKLFTPESWQKLSTALAKTLETGVPYILELQTVRKDGTNGWLWVRGEVEVDQTGKTVGLWGAAQDITERKQAEDELRRSEARMQRVFEILPVGLWFADKGGTLLKGNPAGIKIWGAEPKVSPRDYGVFKAWRLPSGEPVEPEDWALLKTIRDGVTVLDELLEIEGFDGKKRTILNYTTPLLDEDGSVEGAVVVNLDISDRKALETQLNQAQKLESVGRLAGGVAHDFNNMLGVIIGRIELAFNWVNHDHPIFPSLMEIRKAAERSADLTRQLLAFARKQTVSPKVLNLNDTVEGMLKMLRRLIGEDLELAWLPGSNLPPIMVDPSQLDQILANLCVNARDAIVDTGKVTIETDAATFDEQYCAMNAGFTPGTYAVLAVSDDGIGMDKETMAHIFEPFYTTKELGKGTGLGLATVFGIVRQNNGFINVYSEPGEGTTFRIYLPAHVGGEVRVHEVEHSSPAPRGTETVLLVEDEPGILKMTTIMLEMQGYKVIAASRPYDAIAQVARHKGSINVLVTDVVMPGMNGRDLFHQLRIKNPELKCLFMSGYTANVIAHHGVLDAGVHFLQKPFSMKELASKVREVLDGEAKG